MILFYFLYAFFTCLASAHESIFYWDIPPYIWKENDTVTGSLLHMRRTYEALCNGARAEFYRVKGGYKGFMEALNKQTDVETDKGIISRNLNDTWLPYLNASVPSFFLSTYYTTQEMVIIVPRYKIEILHKIGLGLLRSGNFVVLCVILAFLAGIFVWFIVSFLLKKFMILDSHSMTFLFMQRPFLLF